MVGTPPSGWRRWSGLLLTVCVIAAVSALAWFGIQVHNLGIFLILAVAFSVLLDSRRSWITSSVLAFAFYAGYHLLERGHLAIASDEVQRVVSIAVGLLATVLVLSQLKRRLSTALGKEQEARDAAEGERQRLVDHLERITDAFFALDREYRYTYLNGNAEEVARRPRGELLGKCLWDEFPEARGTVFERGLRRAMNEKRAAHFEAYFAPYDSWYENHAYPSAEGITIFVRPINDRKRAEAALLTRARQQAAVAELGLRALSAGDHDSLMDEVVRLTAEVLEVDLAKILELRPGQGELILKAGVGWDPGVVGRATVKADERSQAGYTLQIGGPVVVEDLERELRFRGPDLLVEHGVVSGMSVVIGSRERPFGILGVHTRSPRSFSHDDSNFLQAVANVLGELIERKRAGEALRESESQFRQLAENLDEVLFLQDAAGLQVYYISPTYERIFGRSRRSLYESPRAWLDAVHPEDRARVKEALGPPRRTPDQEFRIVRPDGTIRWIRTRVIPVPSAGPTPDREVGLVEDITERKEADEQRRRLLRVEAARAEAEAAIHARKELMAVVSHDLRSPLNAISLVSQALRMSPPTDVAKLAARIDRSVAQMLRLIADLLELARVDEEGLTLNKRPIAVSMLFDEILESFGPEAESRGLVLEASLEAPASSVVADHDRLIQVLSNLVGNAIKFTTRGEVELRARRKSGELRIAVRDTGAGIPPESLPHVFDRFWQGAADRGGSGVGLGLAIAKGIVEAHGGRIWVESQVGSGTTFHIAIPDAAATQSEPTHRPSVH